MLKIINNPLIPVKFARIFVKKRAIPHAHASGCVRHLRSHPTDFSRTRPALKTKDYLKTDH
ncbi:hypothetical protein CH337_03160 [Rhodoblastus acidophilus]|nr:hypothetical protein CKO16_04035 [Rhodoblastus acidophilus]RAI23247.1 hypothetical protein CH337_03160 [Rhodoblastus acidophilus]